MHRTRAEREEPRRHSVQGYSKIGSIGPYNTDYARCIRQNNVPIPPLLIRSVLQHSGQQARSTLARDHSKKLTVTACISKCASTSASCARVDVDSKQITLSDQTPSTSKQSAVKIFCFDGVQELGNSPSELCSSVLADCLQSVVTGQDAALLCFGQNNDGKQSSIYGNDQIAAQLGLFPTSICWLYRLVGDLKQSRPDTRWSIRVSAVEVFGPNETLADLLVNLNSSTAEGQPPSICIEDDPIFGPQVQHVSELRATSSDRAAGYLDAALSSRHDQTPEEARNSHFFFTLHIYQYQVDQTNTKVAGGRCRLHLIDLAQGERSSKAGRTSLTFPAIGNVLNTIVQGQKYMPFRDSKLTSLLRDSLSRSQVCVMAYGSDDVTKYQETLNTFNVAHILARVKRKQHGKKGSDTSSGIGRSASDPEYTSSSEQSAAETVIFLGNANRDNDGGSSCASSKPAQPRMGSKLPAKHETWIDGPKAQHSSNPGSNRSTPKHKLRGEPILTSEPLWVDGPKASPLHHGRKSRSDDKESADLDPMKRAMIQAWVCEVSTSPVRLNQILSSPCEIPDGAESTDAMKFTETGINYVEYAEMKPKQKQQQQQQQQQQRGNGNGSVRSTGSSIASPPELPAPSQEGSMCTSSDYSQERPVLRSFGCQAEDSDIDTALSHITRAFGVHAFGRTSYMEQLINDVDLHILEDISECDEENLSSMQNSGHAKREQSTSSVPCYTSKDALLHRNEALAARPIQLDLGSLAELDLQLSHSGDSHPLRALSSRDTQHRSDTFSVASEVLDRVSMDGMGDEDDECEMDEDDLERAMAASVSSVKSHDIIMMMKEEMDKQAARDAAHDEEEKGLLQENWQASKIKSSVNQQKGTPFSTNQNQENQKGREISTNQREDLKSRDQIIMTSLPTSPMRTDGPKLSLIKYNQEEGDKPVKSPSSIKSPHLTPLRNLCCTANTTSMHTSGTSSQQSSAYQKLPGDIPPIDTARSERLIRPSIPPLSPAIRSEITSKLRSFTGHLTNSHRNQSVNNHAEANRRPITHLCLNDQSSQLATECCCPVTQVIKNSTLNTNVNTHANNASQPSTIGHTVTLSTFQPVQPSNHDTHNVPSTSRIARYPVHNNAGLTNHSVQISGPTSLPRHGWRRRMSNEDEQQQQQQQQQVGLRQPTGTSPKHAATGTSTQSLGRQAGQSLLSFLKSPAAVSHKTETAPESVNKRASSGYESGHENSLVCAGNSNSTFCTKGVQSPYSKITKPRHRNTAGSSGHGSDSGNSEPLTPAAPHPTPNKLASQRHPSLISSSKSRLPSTSARNRESFSASSGYESCGYRDWADYAVLPEFSRQNHLRHTMPASKSEPQTPCVSVGTDGRMHDSQYEGRLTGMGRMQKAAMICEQQDRVLAIKRRQRELKRELVEAKQRINVPDESVSFELHVEKCMELGDPGLPEALEQETKILAKRVVACQNHVMMVTTFL